jgi:cobalt-zinc-cadmium efflux system outer membrane protein
LLLALVLAACVAGCAARSPHDRDFVSREVRSRTGHSLREAGSASLPPGVDLADGLSEDEAVAVALWNNAELEAALAELGLARADLVEAGLIRNPVFSLLFPLGPKQLEFTLTWPFETLWQRPKRVAAARADVQRVAQRLVQNGLDLVRDVRLAHAELLLVADRARLLRESRDVRARIGAIAEARLRVGDLSALEAAAAGIDAARADDEAGRAARDAESARDRLRSLLGLSDGPGFDATPAEAGARDVADLSALLKEAFAARPELRAAELGVEAAGRRAGLARAEILTLSGMLDANGSGKEGFEMGPGLLVELPLFGRNKGRLARAKAELELESKRYVAARERIALEVRQSRIAVLQARESLATWQERVAPALEQSLARVEKSRDSGEASQLDVLAARRSVLDARLHGAEARAALRRAEAALRHGVGL